MDKSTKHQKTLELVKLVSQPEFEKFIQEIENHSVDSRLEYAKSISNIEELKRREVILPPDIKISIRLFEGETPNETFENDPQSLARGGWSVCVGTVITIGYQF